MPILVKQIIFGVGIVILTLVVFHNFVLPLIHHQWRAILMRVETVITLESIMAIGSYILWRTLSTLPTLLSPHVHHDNSEQHLCRRSLKLNDEKETSSKPIIEEENVKNMSLCFSGRKQTLLWKAFLIFYISMCHVSYLTNIFLSGADPDWFSFLTYLCVGILIQFNTGLLIIKLLSFILRCIQIYFLQHRPDPKPKGLSQRFIICFALLYMFAMSSLGIYTASQVPPVKKVNIRIQNLSSDLNGFRIIQLSDIHLGPTVGKTRLQRIVDIVNTQSADVVVITGDLVDGSARQLRESAYPLSLLHSKYGVLFSSGNHEYYTGDVDNWFRLLQQYNVKVLHNSNIQIPPGSREQICFAGSDDLQADKIGYGEHHFSAADAVKGCERMQPTILLAHQPKAAMRGIDEDVGIDLVLSGHTHGGQIFPINILVYLLQPLYFGLYQYKGSQIYVSTGTQYWGIPMRIGTSMEITAINLIS